MFWGLHEHVCVQQLFPVDRLTVLLCQYSYLLAVFSFTDLLSDHTNTAHDFLSHDGRNL